MGQDSGGTVSRLTHKSKPRQPSLRLISALLKMLHAVTHLNDLGVEAINVALLLCPGLPCGFDMGYRVVGDELDKVVHVVLPCEDA